MISELGVEEGEEREHDEVDRRDIYRWESRPDEFEKVGESAKLREIMDIRGWDEDELRDEMEKRKRLLNLLAEDDIFEYETVVNILRRFEKNPDVVLQEAEDGRLG
jgi:flagellar protein FlaI